MTETILFSGRDAENLLKHLKNREAFSSGSFSLVPEFSPEKKPLKCVFLENRTDILLPDFTITLSAEMLEKILEKNNRLYFIDKNGIRPAEIRGDSYCKLVASNGCPVLEINGIRMHRSHAVSALEDARMKARLVVKNGGITLDTCMGLGYSAIAASLLGAERVLTFEKSEPVFKLASLNPYSRPVFENKGIDARNSDVFTAIHEIEDLSISSVIHDPPRLPLAGELYGREFYLELRRVMKPGARGFHYVGNTGTKYRKRKPILNVERHLAEAGFETKLLPDHDGVLFIRRY